MNTKKTISKTARRYPTSTTLILFVTLLILLLQLAELWRDLT